MSQAAHDIGGILAAGSAAISRRAYSPCTYSPASSAWRSSFASSYGPLVECKREVTESRLMRDQWIIP